jgi:hypothetical protein
LAKGEPSWAIEPLNNWSIRGMRPESIQAKIQFQIKKPEFMGFIVLLVTLWIPCAVFSGVIAEDKGHWGIAWFWAGLIRQRTAQVIALCG